MNLGNRAVIGLRKTKVVVFSHCFNLARLFKLFNLYIDASNLAIGGALVQLGHPIAYYS